MSWPSVSSPGGRFKFIPTQKKYDFILEDITLAYLTFGLLSVLLTDIATLELASTVSMIAIIEVAKGWLYVFLSTGLIYYLTKKAFLLYSAVNDEKFKVYQTTIGGVHHILLNYLNQMQLVTMAAENVSTFNKDILALSNTISNEAVAALTRLGEIEKVSIENIAFGNVKIPANKKSALH